jgi:membrane protease YdiL (CAAX protease family)
MKISYFYNPRFQVIVSWLWLILLPLSLAGIMIGVLQLEMQTMLAWWREHQYFQSYFETLVAGLLPMLFVLLNKDKLARYGMQRQGLGLSIGLALLFTAVMFLRSYFTTGAWINHSNISGELGWLSVGWFTIWGVFANGPLEIFFYIFLLEKTDEIFNSSDKLLSKGFWITTALHALAHIVTTQSVSNALNVFAIFFCLGVIYRISKNAIGPMLSWTLINGMVWAYLSFAGIAPV